MARAKKPPATPAPDLKAVNAIFAKARALVAQTSGGKRKNDGDLETPPPPTKPKACVKSEGGAREALVSPPKAKTDAPQAIPVQKAGTTAACTTAISTVEIARTSSCNPAQHPASKACTTASTTKG